MPRTWSTTATIGSPYSDSWPTHRVLKPIRYSRPQYEETPLDKMGFVAYQVKKMDDGERLRATLEQVVHVPWSLRAELGPIAQRVMHARGRVAAAWHVLWHGP